MSYKSQKNSQIASADPEDETPTISNPIQRYNHFIRHYNKDCNKVNRFTLKELPEIDLTDLEYFNQDSNPHEIDTFIKTFQTNHECVAYYRCYEHMEKTQQCKNKNQDIILNGDEDGPSNKTKKIMQYTQLWLEKNNDAFNAISSRIQNYEQRRQIHA